MNTVQKNRYVRYTWFLIGAVFLVILAGGTVRMTQSGMGCPDWPKCFGMWIPPLDASELPADYQSYLDKQDIDHSFNVYHTWIEYINRLLGALLGVFVFIYLIWSFVITRRTSRRVFFITAFVLFVLTGFQGWLGKTVVDANLAVSKITIHMLVAIILAGLPLINIAAFREYKVRVSAWLRWLPLVTILVVLLQVVLGTQVREEVDIVSKALSYDQRELWIDRLGNIFSVHRSFSWLVLLITGYAVFKYRGISALSKSMILIIVCTIFNILLGVIMAYLDMPAIAQPLHLVGACLLVVLWLDLFLRLRSS